MTARRLALSLAAGLLLLGGPAAGQTVTVTDAQPGATIEAFWNAAPAGAATIDPLGNGSIDMQQLTGAGSVDARVFVDACGERWRVSVVAPGQMPAPTEAGCSRQEMPGVFVVRPISTIIISVTGSSATIRLRQGFFDPTVPPGLITGGRTGLMAFGGMGMASVAPDIGLRACGNVADCTRDGTGLGYTAGFAFWALPFLGAEIAILEPPDLSVEGEDIGFRFATGMDSGALTLSGLFGVPVGRARIYGKVGAAWHRATVTTRQAIDPESVTVGEEGEATVQTNPGGVQTLEWRTEGRGILVGGGIEIWVNRRLAIVIEAGRAGLEGTDTGNGEAVIDDRVIYVLGGARLRLF